MKVILPENIKDITLGQFQKYNELLKRDDLDEYNFNKRKIEIFSNIKRNEIDNISIEDYKDIIFVIDYALNQNVDFEPLFFIDDIEFGFIPNLDKITMEEFVDISNYGSEVETLHKLIAVLFRPVKNKDVFGNYKIYDYKGSEKFSNIMKRTPLSVVNGALVFFSNLANELTSFTQRFIKEEQARESKQATTLISGDGMQQLMN